MIFKLLHKLQLFLLIMINKCPK